MTDKEQTVIFPVNGNGAPAEPVKSFEEFVPVDNAPTEFAASLVSFDFIKAALRRSRRFWCLAAVVGFLLGVGVAISSPPPYKAVTSLLLTPGPYENINTAANNDQEMAQSRTVAALAERRIGLREDAGSFLSSYTVLGLTERVLTVTINAPSASQAVLRANAVASAFLQFRANEMQAEQKLVLASLQQQANQANQRLTSITAQIAALAAQPTSSGQQAQLSNLRAQHLQATGTVANLEQSVLGNQTNVEPAVSAAVRGSGVLDTATPLAHSRLKPLVLYAAIGFIVGLVLGMAIVIIRALLSDKLRRREDVAQALGAPVKLSVGTIPLNRRRTGRRDTAAARGADVQRIAMHLDRALPASVRGTSALAVIPVDDPRIAAMSLVSLAVSWAGQGSPVVVADLCRGAPAATLLGAGEPGVHAVDADGARVIVAVPESHDVEPAGPLGRGPVPGQRSPFTDRVIAACTQPGLLLTLAAVDPAVGGEYLATWATDAVAVVTAGRSSWEQIHAVGEMTRLSGTRLISAVLVGADQTDRSLGLTPAPDTVS